MLVEMRMRVLVSGVLMWKVTLSKSETIWSIAVGAALGRGFWSVDVHWDGMFVVFHSGKAYSGAKRSLRIDSMSTFW
jgi:hypothetical protein